MAVFPRMDSLVEHLSTSAENLSKTLPFPLRNACKNLAQLLRKKLLPLLKELQNDEYPYDDDREFVSFWTGFRQLLIDALKEINKLQKASRLTALLQPSHVTQEIRRKTQSIEEKLDESLQTHVKIAKGMQDKIKGISLDLRKVREELTRKDDLATKITNILREHNPSETRSREGTGRRTRGNVMDAVMEELAKGLETDAVSVRNEWESLKMEYAERFEACADDKQRLEQFLMEALRYFDSSQCQACESRLREEVEREAVPEFICPICNELMSGRNTPVVIVSSGRTICRECAIKTPNDICPLTRKHWPEKQTIENFSLMALIDRWRKTFLIGNSETRQSDGASSSAAEFSVRVPMPQGPTGASELGSFTDLPSSSPGSSDDAVSAEIGTHISTLSSSRAEISTHISTLSSSRARPDEVRKALKELKDIAEYAHEEELLLYMDAIPVISGLLNHPTLFVQQKAVDVLNTLTCERVKPPLSARQRIQVLTAVAENALTGLVALLQSGRTAKSSAERTLINILDDDDAIESIISQDVAGIVTAFYDSFAAAEWRSNNGDSDDNTKSLFVKGMNLLGGSSAQPGTGLAGEEDMAAALLRLARQGRSQRFVEESVLAIRKMVKDGNENAADICRFIHVHNAIPDLIHLIPNEGGQCAEHVIVILNELAISGEILPMRVRREVVRLLLPILKEASHSGGNSTERFSEATRLLYQCIAFLENAEGDISLSFSVGDLKCLISVLRNESLTSVSFFYVVTSMKEIFSREEGCTLKMTFLGDRGVASLTTLLEKFHSTARVSDSVAQLCSVISSNPRCRQEFIKHAGLQLLYGLLSDDSLNSPYTAAKAARDLLSESESGSPISALDGFPYRSIVRLLRASELDKCRRVATELLGEYAARSFHSSESSATVESEAIKLLLGMVRDENRNHLRERAASVLLTFAQRDASAAHLLAQQDGVAPLVQFWESQGHEGRPACVKLLVIFCNANDDCKHAMLDRRVLNYFLNCLQRGSMSMREGVAEALAHLVDYQPARIPVVEADFYREAIECMRLNVNCRSSIHLLHALATIIENKSDVNSLTVLGVQDSIGRILRGSYHGKSEALQVLLKLLRLDEDFTPTTEIIASVCLMLRGSGSIESSDVLYVLEVLKISANKRDIKIAIVRGEGVSLLVKASSPGPGFLTSHQEAALEVLLHLSRKGSESEAEYVNALMSRGFCLFLLSITRENPGSSSDYAAHSALCIIRNLSLASGQTIQWLAEDGVVQTLLERIHLHLQAIDGATDAVTSLCVIKASVVGLEKFLDSKDGRVALKTHDGIAIILRVWYHFAREDQILRFCTRLLNNFICGDEDDHERKEACRAILEAKPDVIICMKGILDLGNSQGPKHEAFHEACDLFASLIYYGNRKQIGQRIRSEGIDRRLKHLGDGCCRDYADPILSLTSDGRGGFVRLLTRKNPRHVHGHQAVP